MSALTFTATQPGHASDHATVEFLGISQWRGVMLSEMTREQLIRTCCEMGECMRQEQEKSARERESLFKLLTPRPVGSTPLLFLLAAAAVAGAILARHL